MKREVPILEYHDLSSTPGSSGHFHSPYVLLSEKFYEQMSWLFRQGYRTLTIDDLLTHPGADRLVAITFDDGHISNYSLAFSILKEFNFRATFFIVPSFVGSKNYVSTSQLKEMHESGMKIESHSLTHPYMYALPAQEMLHEIIESKKWIQDVLKDETNHFSVPYGMYGKDLVEHLKKAGYKSMVTENYGYYKYNDVAFHVLPRFTIKAHFDLKTFRNIIEGRKLLLTPDYFKATCLRLSKAILGYRNYIYLKSLLLKNPVYSHQA